MILIDSHAHIYLGEFEQDLAAVLQRAREEGVDRILLPAIDSATHESMLGLASRYPETCLSMMGLHPCSVKENFEDELRTIEAYLASQKFAGVGEIGLDFFWDLSFKEQQYNAFGRQLQLALQYDLPVSIHSRNATKECIEVVGRHQNGRLKGVFHCFSGTLDEAKQVTDLGFFLGIGGVLTFKNSGLDKVVKDIDISCMVLETDAPYLAPVPFRGKRNESSYLKFVVQKLAEIKGTPVGEVAEITTQNAKKLFGL